MLCSSAVTIHFVLAKDFKNCFFVQWFNGMYVDTSAEIPFASNASAAISASQTRCPVLRLLRQFLRSMLLSQLQTVRQQA
jgi:hypothetical protein